MIKAVVTLVTEILAQAEACAHHDTRPRKFL